VFTAEHESFWAVARKTHGDAAGTRVLVEVLLLHRHLDRVNVLAGITAAQSGDGKPPRRVRRSWLRRWSRSRHETLHQHARCVAGKQSEPSTDPPHSGRLQITESLRK
jgi:hypothetical protein